MNPDASRLPPGPEAGSLRHLLSSEDERSFRAEYSHRSVHFARVALILATLLYAIFGLLDESSAPESKETLWTIRYTFVCPLFLVALVATFIPRLRSAMQQILAHAAIVGGAGILAMIAIIEETEPGFHYYFAGLMLVSIWAFTFLRLHFVHATLIGWGMVVAYELIAVVRQFPSSDIGLIGFLNANFFLISANILGMFAGYFIEVYARRDFIQRRIIEGDQEKVRGLLFNTLPEEIAERLKGHNATIADHHDEVSILFADIVNFSTLSVELPPIELVKVLDDLFSHFDALVEEAGLEKIKTMGDCYMVAAGVPIAREDHAQVVVNLALRMLDYAGSRSFGCGHLVQLRIGINSGPVVAGVIGRRKFTYDLWGDTVNTASRMQSSGAVGHVQISRSTKRRIENDFLCMAAGTVDVKGKGPMDVWLVVGPKSLDAPGDPGALPG